MEKWFCGLAMTVLLVAGCGEGVSGVDNNASALGEKITICHATGSATNPYVEITISVNAIPAHLAHQYGKDIIPAPAEGCNAPCTSEWCDPLVSTATVVR
jgi:hypothetical protein